MKNCVKIRLNVYKPKILTWTPNIPNTMKNAQQMRTIFPMGLRDVIRVSTTSFRPGARLITLKDTQTVVLYMQVEQQTYSCVTLALT